MNLFDQPLAIVDTETTGMSPIRDRVIEIGIIRIEEGKVVEEFSTLINPEVYIPREITVLTGIYAQQLEDAPLFTDIARKVKELIDGAKFVAHNARFDYAFIKQEFRRLDLPFRARTIDTVALSRKLFPEFRRHDLSSIIERFGITMEARHRALDDAKAVWEFIQKANTKVGNEWFAQTALPFISPKRIATQIDETILNSLPDGPGVYSFYDQDGALLYIGKSVNIKDRVLSHFYADSESTKELNLTHHVSHIETQVTAGELSALLLESELIKQQSPIYNRRLRKRSGIVVGVEDETPDGYKTIRYGRQSEMDSKNYQKTSSVNSVEIPAGVYPGLRSGAGMTTTLDPSTILGLYKSLRATKDHLADLAHTWQLCPKLLGIEKTKGGCFSSRLGICLGACTGKEPPEIYNERFLKAFESERIKQWPYDGPIIIEEQSSSVQGQAFQVENWVITKKISYDEAGENIESITQPFDLDSYRILASVIFKPPKGVKIKKLNQS